MTPTNDQASANQTSTTSAKEAIIKAASLISEGFKILRKHGILIGITHTIEGEVQLQVSSRRLQELADLLGKLSCVDRQPHSELFPIRKYFYIDDIQFFALFEDQS